MIFPAKRIAAALALFFCLMLTNPVSARPIWPYNFARLAQDAAILVTGEVVETTVVEQIPAEKSRWHAALVRMRAGVRVLRDPYSAKPYVMFYVTKRVGGGVQNFDAIKALKFGVS